MGRRIVSRTGEKQEPVTFTMDRTTWRRLMDYWKKRGWSFSNTSHNIRRMVIETLDREMPLEKKSE